MQSVLHNIIKLRGEKDAESDPNNFLFDCTYRQLLRASTMDKLWYFYWWTPFWLILLFVLIVNYFHHSASWDYLHAKSIEMRKWDICNDSEILTLFIAADTHKCKMVDSMVGNSLIYSKRVGEMSEIDKFLLVEI